MKKQQVPLSSDLVLVDRRQAEAIFGICLNTVRRMEADGHLTPVRLRAGPTAKTYYRKDEVLQLAGKGIAR